MAPIYWFAAPIGRSTWDVFFSLPGLTAQLKYSNRIDAGGVTLVSPAGKRQIFINASLPRLDQDIATYHELCGHASLWGARMSPANEERLLRAQSRNAWLALRALGFGWPKRPAGLTRLEHA